MKPIRDEKKNFLLESLIIFFYFGKDVFIHLVQSTVLKDDGEQSVKGNVGGVANDCELCTSGHVWRKGGLTFQILVNFS